MAKAAAEFWMVEQSFYESGKCKALLYGPYSKRGEPAFKSDPFVDKHTEWFDSYKKAVQCCQKTRRA